MTQQCKCLHADEIADLHHELRDRLPGGTLTDDRMADRFCGSEDVGTGRGPHGPHLASRLSLPSSRVLHQSS